MTNPADYLSDEDAERMARAANPSLWGFEGAPILKASSIEAIRRAWSSRPESARDLDKAAAAIYDPATDTWTHNEDAYLRMDDVSLVRGRELLKASGGNIDEPSDNKSPTGGAA